MYNQKTTGQVKRKPNKKKQLDNILITTKLTTHEAPLYSVCTETYERKLPKK